MNTSHSDETQSQQSAEQTVDCIIPNPGSVTTAEKIGSFLQKDAVTRPATCILKEGKFLLRCKDMYNTDVDLISLPTTAISQVTYRNVTKQEESGAEIKSCAGYGAGMGVAAAVITFMNLNKQHANVDFGVFIPIALGMIAVFAVGGLIVGAIKTAGKSGASTGHVEFRLSAGDKGVIVALRIPPDRSNVVAEAFRSVGWKPELQRPESTGA